MFWPDERLDRKKTNTKYKYSLCCQQGKVDLPLLNATPPLLDTLLDINGDSTSRHFRNNIRSYNAAFSWTSFGAKFDPKLINSRGPYSLILCGENYHFMGSLLPPNGQHPRYSQLYVHDPNSEVNERISQFPAAESKLHLSLIQQLQDMLDEYNILTKTFRQVRASLEHSQNKDLRLRITGQRIPNGKQYELPSGVELAGLIPGDFEPNHEDRDIIVNNCNSGLQRITSLHPLFDSLHFPLLFPYGNDGFHNCIKYNPIHIPRGQKRQHVTQREYYCFRIQYRNAEGSTLIRGGKTLQHYCIDAFTTVEQNRLTYLRNNQKALRSEIYSELYSALDRGETSSKNIGRIILPSSFTGGMRYMKQLFLDAMAICHYFGNPDLFITFTSNAQWPEITNAFKNKVGSHGEDKPAIVARGMHTVEFQKRGLPHVHILVWLANNAKLETQKQIDQIISAQLPNPTEDPIGYASVTKFMIHGPCGIDNPKSPCMVDGKCKKKYPKAYNTETISDRHGYTLYKREKTKITVNKSGKFLDNRYIVPYNRHLIIKYQAHINIEICHKGQLIKYLFKYITKGPDRQTVVAETTSLDEIAQYLDCRSISSYEAIWRLFEYPIHERKPNVVRLSIHMPLSQSITYQGSQTIRSIVGRPGITNTMLTQWFVLNQRDPSARKYTYDKIPNAYVWSTQLDDWSPRKQGFAVGRIPSVPAASGDIFYLRMLLGKISGALNFKDLRTLNGIVYDNYQQTCQAMGLLSSDNEWDLVMSEISRWAHPAIIRSMFVSLLIFCQVSDPSKLLANWWESMSEDFAYRKQQLDSIEFTQPQPIQLYDQLLNNLDYLLHSYSLSLEHFKLPHPMPTVTREQNHNNILTHHQYDKQTEESKSKKYYASLNSDQIRAYSSIMDAIETKKGKFFFVHGHGGTGKTFLYNCIISKVRSTGGIALVVASSGIAATLLPDGVTAHSRFKIPLEIDNLSTCTIKKGSDVAELLKSATLIVWDEAPMIHKLSFEAVDRTMCDIMNMPLSGENYVPFGGKVVLLGGDFRQTLPVVPNGSREDNINATLINMRITTNSINTTPMFDGLTFPDWVLAVGNGTLRTYPTKKNTKFDDLITIPSPFLIQTTTKPLDELISRVYPSFIESYQSLQYIKSRAIVSPTNAVVSEINNILLAQIPVPSKIYFSSDSLSPIKTNIATPELEYPLEFLNSLSFNGIPEHKLELKPFTVVMLLRNINPTSGMLISGLIVSGTQEGTTVAIPRIILDVTDNRWPFTLRRRQFPIRICYAMTINKSQGQTLDHVGIYLPKPVFSHGQLYVAVSRVRSANGLHILIPNISSNPDNKTRNIVYQDILHEITGI
ncbi:ATP-dependent DNA helicase PIF1 [Linum perenne]